MDSFYRPEAKVLELDTRTLRLHNTLKRNVDQKYKILKDPNEHIKILIINMERSFGALEKKTRSSTRKQVFVATKDIMKIKKASKVMDQLELQVVDLLKRIY